MALRKIQQFFAVKESTEGTYAGDGTLLVAGQAVLGMDVEWSPAKEESERNTVGDSAANDKSDIGQQTWDCNLKLDFGADGNAGGNLPNEPKWGEFIRACGMRHQIIESVDLTGSVTGTFVHWEGITGAGGAKGLVVGSYTGSGHTRMLYLPTNAIAFATSEVITGDDSGATVTTEVTPAVGDSGRVYQPTSWIIHSIERGAWTGTPKIGELVKGGTSLATATILGPLGDLSGTDTLYFEPGIGTLESGETLTGQESAATCTTSAGPVADSNYTMSVGAILGGGTGITTRGARGNWKLALEAGKTMMMEFSFKMVQQAVADKALIPSFTPAVLSDPLRFASANFTVDALAMLVGALEIDLGATPAVRPSASAAEGALSIRVGERTLIGKIDPEWLAPGSHDFMGKWAAGTTVSIKSRMGLAETAVGTSSHTVGKAVWLDFPQAQYTGIPFGEREAIRTADATFAARRITAAGEDEIRIFVL